jgi:hypothetical protein
VVSRERGATDWSASVPLALSAKRERVSSPHVAKRQVIARVYGVSGRFGVRDAPVVAVLQALQMSLPGDWIDLNNRKSQIANRKSKISPSALKTLR